MVRDSVGGKLPNHSLDKDFYSTRKKLVKDKTKRDLDKCVK